ncbi:MAG: nucleotidyltransferase domain-containing protein [Chloroflexi bacterium]|nr:MAG: nucleotidyltransferase domain-containing protein [Chloroflexota bacterium]
MVLRLWACKSGVKRMTDNYPVPVTDTLLKEITRRIVERFDPERIVLFGSRATGSSRTDSDVDLLVVMDTNRPPIQRAIEVKRACRPRFVSMDVLVKTPQEMEARLERGSFFLRQILEQGKVLYERQP